jgi:hypothetical protein
MQTTMQPDASCHRTIEKSIIVSVEFIGHVGRFNASESVRRAATVSTRHRRRGKKRDFPDRMAPKAQEDATTPP